jgi:hypothetical protein
MRFDDLLARDVEELHQDIAAIKGEASLMDALGSLGRVEMPQSVIGGPARSPAGRAVIPDGWERCSQDWPASEMSACRARADLGDARSARRLAELLELADQHVEAGAWWHRAADLGDQDAVAYLLEVCNRT